MVRRLASTLLLILVWGTAIPVAKGQSPGARHGGLPALGVELLRPSLGQLRPLLGRVVRITLVNGKQIDARLLAAWPSVIRVTFADGRSGTVARHRIRSVTHLGAHFTPLATQDAHDSGRILAYLGLGLTVGGVVLGGALAPPLFVVGSRFTCPGILDCVPPATTAAIFVTALSASALAAGVPLWIAGVVRQKVHGRTGAAAKRARRLYRGWGMGLTVTGAGLAGLGAALFGVGASDIDRLNALRWAGAITGPLGVFISLCIGLPMWVEAVRKVSTGSAPAPAPAHAPGASTTQVPQDTHHLQAWNAHHSPAGSAAVFAYGWQY